MSLSPYLNHILMYDVTSPGVTAVVSCDTDYYHSFINYRCIISGAALLLGHIYIEYSMYEFLQKDLPVSK